MFLDLGNDHLSSRNWPPCKPRWTSWESTRALGTDLKERGFQIEAQDLLAEAYEQLVTGGVPTRKASTLAGVSKATMTRRWNAARVGCPRRSVASRPAPANKLGFHEEAEILATLNSERFVDQSPEQVRATLLSEGRYLCSVSSMYRLLHRAKQVAEHRRQARHPAKDRAGAGRVPAWRSVHVGYHQARRTDERRVFRCLRDDRYLFAVHRRLPGSYS